MTRFHPLYILFQVFWVLVVALVAVAVVPQGLSQEADMFSVVVDIDKDSVSVQMGGDLDICKTFTCPSGTRCEMVTSPALLKIPVPRCVPDQRAPATPDNGEWWELFDSTVL